jgi:hypothetical protein
MGFKAWLAANRNDEREQTLTFRAGAGGFTVMSAAGIVLACVYMWQNRADDAMTIIAIVALGQMAFWGLLLRWKVTR